MIRAKKHKKACARAHLKKIMPDISPFDRRRRSARRVGMSVPIVALSMRTRSSDSGTDCGSAAVGAPSSGREKERRLSLVCDFSLSVASVCVSGPTPSGREQMTRYVTSWTSSSWVSSPPGCAE